VLASNITFFTVRVCDKYDCIAPRAAGVDRLLQSRAVKHAISAVYIGSMTCKQATYRKARTRGRTDHTVAGVTYLQFPIDVRFSSSLQIWFSNFTLSLSAEKNVFDL